MQLYIQNTNMETTLSELSRLTLPQVSCFYKKNLVCEDYVDSDVMFFFFSLDQQTDDSPFRECGGGCLFLSGLL